MSENKLITVTSPLLPKLEDFIPMLQDIWDRKWLTNNGHYHKELEKALADYLGVKYISLFTNGTLPLITALQAMRISGEVITTPYSFVATTHSIWWNGLKPVFVDVDEATGNIDPEKIEAAITPHKSIVKEYLNPWVISGYSLMVFSLVSNVYVLSQGVLLKELGTIEAASYLFVPALAFICFKEKIKEIVWRCYICSHH